MATVGGLTNSTSNSLRGYGGLASGMDRDTLIEGMTYGTTSKITQQEQKKQQLEWKQNAVRAISDMMIAFANKYTASLTSSNNLFSSMLWGRNNITASGANSKYVSVTGTASAADAITIMGVKQMAQDAKWSSSESVSNMQIQTGKIGDITYPADFDQSVVTADKPYLVQNLVGKTLDFKYGGDSYSITLGLTNSKGELNNYTTAEGIAAAINDQLSKVEVNDKTKLSDVVKFNADGNGINVKVTGREGGNEVKMVGGTNSAMDLLGFDSKDDKGKAAEITLKRDGQTGAELGTKEALTKAISFAEKVGGKSMTFSYNGKSATIKLPAASELGKGQEEDNKTIQESIQKQLDSAFGKNRIRVGLNDGKFDFTTYDPSTVKRNPDGTPDWDGAKVDNTSTLSIASGHSDLVGKNGVFGIKAGITNRVNLNEGILNSGSKVTADDLGKTITINGETLTITEKTTINQLMKDINKSGAGVTVSYQTVGDKFTFTSNEKGASGSIQISGDAQLLNHLFGVDAADIQDLQDGVQGQDAVVAVKYKGSDDVVELIRDTNSFTVDGLSIGVKGTFGYDEDGNRIENFEDPVEINAQVDVDNIVDNIKSMVDEYNKIIELVNKELTSKPDRDYSPLTSEQKKELSESEIETWEEKAKTGMLYGDSDLRSLSSDLRFIMSGGTMEAFRKIGITTSTLYSDNGKLTVDETKLRAALETDPESVEKLFTSGKAKDEKGNDITGIATNLKNVMDKYVRTMGSMDTKGILIKKAGSTSSPMSLTENSIYKQLTEINKQISKLQTRLESERDRYIKQFTSLETLISQMNSQSSWLSQLGGY